MGSQLQKAVFLDRDGTIIEDLHFLDDPDRVKFLPGALEALKYLHENGFLLVVITNQSGVARGYFDENTCSEINARMVGIMSENGVPVAGKVYYCPHLPGAPVPEYDRVCECRKPGKGLFIEAAGELGIDFTISWAVGDSLRDLVPAKNLGARTVLLLTGKGREQAADKELSGTVDKIASNLLDAAVFIVESSR